jgi:hypothetical protein
MTFMKLNEVKETCGLCSSHGIVMVVKVNKVTVSKVCTEKIRGDNEKREEKKEELAR